MNKQITILLCVVLSFCLLTSISVAKEKELDNKVVKKTSEKKESTPAQSKSNNKNDSKININSSITVNPNLNIMTSPTTVAPQTGEQINWQVISSGGTYGTSTNYILAGTVGQTAVGLGSSPSYQIRAGYWQNFASGPVGCCVGMRGNVDGDASDGIDIGDLVYFVTYSFGGGPPPPCLEEADVDGSTGLDIGDIVYLVTYMFGGGPAPVACP